MHGLILAGGEGSRLAADGVAVPKALIDVAGRPQVVELAGTLTESGCRSVTIMVRAGFVAQVRDAVAGAGLRQVTTESCLTPSSLHTLAAGLGAVPPGAVVCAMVDTVMPRADWSAVVAGIRRGLSRDRAMVLAVTEYVADESPLWVERDAAGDVMRLGPEPVSPPCVTGGVYGLSPAARILAQEAPGQGLERMRHFLRWAVDRGMRVGSVSVPRIIDLDRRDDLEQARAWLAPTVPQNSSA